MADCQLTHKQLDVLREIGNIGAGNAATSMSELMNKRIHMEVPNVNVLTIDEITEILGGPEQIIAAVCFRIYGEIPGAVYFTLPIEEAESLIFHITKGSEINLLSNQTNELAISALKEVGNILTGSYLSALADFMNVHMQSSIPYFSLDMAGAVLTTGLIELSKVSEHAIIIDTEINNYYTSNGIKGHFFLLPDEESIPKLFSALGIHEYG